MSRSFSDDSNWKAHAHKTFSFVNAEEAELLMLERMCAPLTKEELRWGLKRQQQRRTKLAAEAEKKQLVSRLADEAAFGRKLAEQKRRRSLLTSTSRRAR